ncbi:general secretion pathway protein GspK [Mangrovimicrobium sediminis]|uniref:Type II secretion system protein K n=1 Tax=Mangrovimicrobium sediminis TaxID=2562682 RepID=A0A4Z0M4H3_9GAMM|nr:general secretion pathway protein GspK [Haliea sp. SAOS-164]
MALLIFAISAALIVAMRAEFERVYERASIIFRTEQGLAYLRGAEGLATLALLTDYDQDKTAEGERQDTLQDVWARPAQPYPLDEGWMEGELEDLQGRFNLNLLAQDAPEPEEGNEARFTPAQAQFIRLLQAAAEPEINEIQAAAIAQAIGDWVDDDGETRPDGAEGDYYAGQTPAYRAPNRPMLDVSELRAVRGMTPELYDAIAPWVTVWPLEDAALNIHTAPLTVLRSLGSPDSLVPLSEADALELIAFRCTNPYAGIEDWLDQPVLAPFKEKLNQPNGGLDLLGETSDYFLLRARAEVAGRITRLYSVLHRENRQVSVLSRTADARAFPQELERENPCER